MQQQKQCPNEREDAAEPPKMNSYNFDARSGTGTVRASRRNNTRKSEDLISSPKDRKKRKKNRINSSKEKSHPSSCKVRRRDGNHNPLISTSSEKSTLIAPSCIDNVVLATPVSMVPYPDSCYDFRYILAPMVGASEVAFRLLCRKYGATLAYTPMMSSETFDQQDEDCYSCYLHRDRNEEMMALLRRADRKQTVAHFAANHPVTFVQACKTAQDRGYAGCDLNLGCPQRTAYMGHFGSYLLDEPELIYSMVHAAVQTVSIPVSIKIRLMDTMEATLNFCRQICRAGAALITVHGRHRASWERTSKSARDGPALLDQVAEIRRALCKEFPSVRVITNGNTVTWHDVQNNLELTKADGLMSAEGLLDNPALFLSRHGTNPTANVQVWTLKASTEVVLKIEKLQQKLQKMVQRHQQKEHVSETTTEMVHFSAKFISRQQKLQKLRSASLQCASVSLEQLQRIASNKMMLCHEYLDWAEAFPPNKWRTVLFHVRRMLKNELTKYQLLESCLECPTVPHVRIILIKLQHYQQNPTSFVFDQEKAKQEHDALELRRVEEGKRRNFEARMQRKAKREGFADLDHYLRIGAAVPTDSEISEIRLRLLHKKQFTETELMSRWKELHGQHCWSYHIRGSCPRDRSCAFLHVPLLVPPSKSNSFVEQDELAG